MREGWVDDQSLQTEARPYREGPRIITYSVRYGASEDDEKMAMREAAGEQGIGPKDICVGLVEFSDADLSAPEAGGPFKNAPAK